MCRGRRGNKITGAYKFTDLGYIVLKAILLTEDTVISIFTLCIFRSISFEWCWARWMTTLLWVKSVLNLHVHR